MSTTGKAPAFKNPIIRWIDHRLPMFSYLDHELNEYPTPRNLNYMWSFGSLAGFMLVVMIVTGIMLALARVMGETAPLLILVGYSQAMNFNMFNGFMGSLPGMMFDQTSAGAGANPVPTDRLWGAALTLVLLIALLNISARFVSKFFSPKKV